MNKPTLMNPDPDPPRPASTPSRFDPAKIRVLDVESESEGTVVRFDCYEGEADEDLFRVAGDEVEVRRLAWARSSDMNAKPEVQWTGTGLTTAEVDQIRVFSWPEGELVHVYENVR
jgi:hypothetical protein